MDTSRHVDLQQVARDTLRAYGFQPDVPVAVAQQLAAVLAAPPAVAPGGDIRDLRGLLWSSIDNDTSRDLDQIEFAEALPSGGWRVLVGIADVDAFVPKHTPIDDYASVETATLYTGVHNFPMLPEALSTGATSLLETGDRLAVIAETTVTADGTVSASAFYRAVVRNHAQLTYDAVGAWLEGRAPAPPKVAASAPLQAQLRLQDTIAQALRTDRSRHGALNLETIETSPVMAGGQVVSLVRQQKNHATELIEDFMIASNGAVAREMQTRRLSSIRRVVRVPERWPRIVELAAAQGVTLPAAPDAGALNAFLLARQQADPDHFPDLSLSVVKLLGPGEYVLEHPGDPETGHFGLAVQAYTHSTAPNRRYADLISQRIVKAALAGAPPPYSDEELAAIAKNCTLKEDAARKVEREMTKRIAAVMMSTHIGETFDAMVTGATPKGTFVRVLQPHVEGLLAQGAQGLDVGDTLRVRLIRVDVSRGFIDFGRV